jgi:SAM-dependent methyltransferase
VAELHEDRVRARSFGSIAERYDRYRLSYPDALIDDLAELRPASVLDVGCGTGKASVALAGRGLAVLGVEVDERMAQVARGHGIDVRVATFEDWPAAGRTFDLVTCGDAWHWIDPVRGARKAAEVLRPGGTIARFWTTLALSEPVIAAFEPVYRDLAPEVAQVWRPHASQFHATRADPLSLSGDFTPARTLSFPWDVRIGADDWVGLASTISDHQRLGTERLNALMRSLRATIENLGGVVPARAETYALLNERL